MPEFRGCNRKVMPQWLLVAMHHSGLFEDHRIPIATAISWYHDADEGGELAYYPDGAASAPVAHRTRKDTALVLDTDSVFHGVDRVASAAPAMAPLRPGMSLDFVGDHRWAVHDGDATVVAYDTTTGRAVLHSRVGMRTDRGLRSAYRADPPAVIAFDNDVLLADTPNGVYAYPLSGAAPYARDAG